CDLSCVVDRVCSERREGVAVAITQALRGRTVVRVEKLIPGAINGLTAKGVRVLLPVRTAACPCLVEGNAERRIARVDFLLGNESVTLSANVSQRQHGGFAQLTLD